MIHILGGGLAGSEAAWQVSRAGARAVLYEMRPQRATPAHKTTQLAELVCSNSLKSESENSAPWLLKQELRRLDSLLLRIAAQVRVPAGHALTVDREVFAAEVTRAIESAPGIEVRREEVTRLPEDGIVIIATGPLTSDALAQEIARLTGTERLFFYDSISPIVEADSIDMSIAFRASRYGKSLDGSDDYINCPFNKEEYERFLAELLEAQSHTPHIPDDVPYFEACLPIEEIARRGPDTLRFGPMKPVGLTDPRTGRWPYAAVQLRQENLRADSYNLVGFQNYLRYPDQKRVFRLIPGLEKAEFVRYGQIHRNTYINAPAVLLPTLQMRRESRVLFAGQIAGIEGYVESIATGLLAGRNAAALERGAELKPLPAATALGSLCRYVSGADPRHYQPANITFDLLPQLDEAAKKRLKHDKRARHAEVCRRAQEALDEYLAVPAQ
ncbi:MAG: methylenetetrahydrofolate--tRNA-(uracil(54)-C(5))-methyltransferase (FADH(2)-oxidizing) TrmFO [Bryobacterales bacterium]|nr:methylenetetrahydrofolate--tRNA-(uracil(54)-C(5))-methyltransferase (FADH(2)-oxidizing) TrmFO [Bryobacterales bacterium]